MVDPQGKRLMMTFSSRDLSGQVVKIADAFNMLGCLAVVKICEVVFFVKLLTR